MSKRFTDIDKWEKPWFRRLDPIRKLVFLYVLDKCDRAGYWQIDVDRLWFDLNVAEPIEEPWRGIKDIRVEDGYLWVVDFVKFQYPTGLQRHNRAHKGIFDAIEKIQEKGVFSKPQESPKQGAKKGLKGGKQGGQEKEEDKEVEEDKEGPSSYPSSFSPSSSDKEDDVPF